MKKIFLFAATAALVLFTGCAKHEDFTPVNDTAKAIGFTNYAPRSITKAGSTLVNSGALPSGSTIGVFGYSTATANFPSTTTAPNPAVTPTFMTNLPVAYSSTTSATATETNPVRYWPKTITNLLSFFAYYPYNSTAITSKPDANTNALGAFDFTQTGDVTTMVDFMISDVANDYYYESGSATNSNGQKTTTGTVPLTLHHMLSKVNFKFAKGSGLGNDVEIKVTSATIAGVLATGSITPQYTASETPGQAGSTAFANTWATANTAYASAVSIPIASEDGNYLILSETAALNSNSASANNFLFVPQSLGNAVIVTINYDLTQNNVVTHNTSTVQLNTGTTTAWNRNANIVYTFTIGLQPIKFTATVTGWDNETSGGFNI